MPHELKDMDISKVSLVDRGANGRTFAVLKRDAPPLPDLPPDERAGLLATIAKALGVKGFGAAPLAKAETFASIIAGEELEDALYDSWETLRSSLWNAVYAWDYDADQPASIAQKQALVGQNLDEFKAWLLAAMDGAASIAKRDEPASQSRHLAAFIRKVGKKISAARLERLQSAADALAEVLAEVASADEESDIEKEAEMTLSKEDIAQIAKAVREADAPDPVEAAVAKAIEPLQAEIAALKKGEASGPDDAGETDQGEGISLEALSKDGEIPGAITKILVGVMTPVLDRLEKVEKAINRGQQTSADGQDESKVKKSASGWKARM
jgi:hypothetical protein